MAQRQRVAAHPSDGGAIRNPRTCDVKADQHSGRTGNSECRRGGGVSRGGRSNEGQRSDLASADDGETGAVSDGGPAAQNRTREGVVGVADHDAAGSHRGGDRSEIETGAGAGTGDRAEIKGESGNRGAGAGRTGTSGEQRRGEESLGVGAAGLSRHVQGAPAEFQRTGTVENRDGRCREIVEVEAERAAEHRGLAGVIGRVGRRERQCTRAHLDESPYAERAAVADAAPDEAGEFGAGRAGDGQVVTREVQDAARGNRAEDVRSLNGRDSDVAIQLGDIADGVIPIKDIASGGAVVAVAHVERVGVIEQESAD